MKKQQIKKLKFKSIYKQKVRVYRRSGNKNRIKNKYMSKIKKLRKRLKEWVVF